MDRIAELEAESLARTEARRASRAAFQAQMFAATAPKPRKHYHGLTECTVDHDADRARAAEVQRRQVLRGR